MALFVVQHQHPAERCPAKDPQMGAMLLRHLSAENAANNGITIQSEAVIDGAHTLYLILDAPTAEVVQRYMAPFAQAGSVNVMAASPCEVVIERGGCDVA